MIKIDHVPGTFDDNIDWPCGDGTEAMTHAFNQLMGQTEKGDTISFHRVQDRNMDLFAGLLKDKDGKPKILIPLLLSKEEGTILTEYYYYGEIVESDMGYYPKRRVLLQDCDIDKEVREQFLAG